MPWMNLCGEALSGYVMRLVFREAHRKRGALSKDERRGGKSLSYMTVPGWRYAI